MSGFDDKTIDIVERLLDCAELDSAEGCESGVVNLMYEAAELIEQMRKRLTHLAGWRTERLQ